MEEISKAWILMLHQDLQRTKNNPFPPNSDLILRMCHDNVENKRTLFCMMAETRDIKNGKGYQLPMFYLADEWVKIYPKETVDALIWICSTVGCWKDLKRWSSHFMKEGTEFVEPFIHDLVQKMNEQVRIDENLPVKDRSYLSKWIPREKANRVMFDLLAEDWDGNCMNEKNQNSIRSKYRKILSKMHREYDEYKNSDKYVRTALVDTIGNAIAKITLQEGVLLERTEKEMNDILCNKFPETFPMPKNTLIVLHPSPNSFQYMKQIAVLLQFWRIQRSNPQFLLYTHNQFQYIDWSEQYKTHAELIHALWKIHIHLGTIRSPLSCMISTMPLPTQNETAEKMTWIILSDYDTVPVHEIAMKRQTVLPHMVYIDSTSDCFLKIESSSITKTFPCRVFQERCTMLAATEDGLTVEQWKQIVLKTYSSDLRNACSWEFLQSILEIYRPMNKLVNFS